MHAKLVVLILSIACGALTLLVVRHLRLQADHEMAAARLRILSLDATLWDLRAQIAKNVTPERIDELTDQSGEFTPIVPVPIPDPMEYVFPTTHETNPPAFRPIGFPPLTEPTREDGRP